MGIDLEHGTITPHIGQHALQIGTLLLPFCCRTCARHCQAAQWSCTDGQGRLVLSGLNAQLAPSTHPPARLAKWIW